MCGHTDFLDMSPDDEVKTDDYCSELHYRTHGVLDHEHVFSEVCSTGCVVRGAYCVVREVRTGRYESHGGKCWH